MNSNAFSGPDSNSTSFGAIVRDSKGAFCGGLSVFSDDYLNVLTAKSSAMLVGLSLLLQLGFSNYIVESNSLNLINLIRKGLAL